MTTADALNHPLPETIAAERLRQHLEDIARERDNAYRALQEREAELARIQRIGKVGGLEVDFREGFKNRRSPEYLMLHGLPPEAADESHEEWVTRIHPDDRPHVLQQSVQGEASLKPFVLEARYKDSSGEWRWLRSESQPRWDPTGKDIGFIGVAHDITAAKQAEIELRKLNETLEERIAERTAELESNEARLRAILETSNQ